MARRPRIYLDYHASTPVDPRVLEQMLPYFTDKFGNASSRHHGYGFEADAAVSDARLRVLELVNAKSPDEIVFTSGATESNNFALRGVVEATGKRHVVTSPIEHPCVLETCRYLEQNGVAWTSVEVGADGVVAPEAVEAAMRPDTALVSVMTVNNEIGTIQPIRAIAEVARRHGALMHTDAAQAAGRVPLDVRADGVDLMSLSGHKIYGPKGVGALYVRRFPEVTPLARQMHGGMHERGMRSGTLNVAGIVGFGAAAQLAGAELADENARLGALRDGLLERLRRDVPELRVHGSLERRVASNLNVSFGVRGDTFLSAVPELALSGGAACASGKPDASHVLGALGVDKQQAHAAIRIGLGRPTTAEEVDEAGELLVAAARRFRERRAAKGDG